MRKTKLLILTLLLLGLNACGIKHTDPWDKLDEKLNNSKTYKIVGEMTIVNNEDKFKYNVIVDYKKPDNYKVTLSNSTNNHKQIILKNKNGVYVVTPALNKSFKFQSEWPENSSQSYLLDSIIKDIKSTKEIKNNKKNNLLVINAKVNYPNNSRLTNEDIYFDKKGNLKKVLVLDKEKQPIIKMIFNKIKFNVKYNNDFFKLKSMLNDEEDKCDTSECKKDEKESSIIEDVVYPLYVPKNTSLASKEQVNGVSGERFIMTYEGSKPFMIIEEANTKNKEMQVTNVYGNPEILTASIGALSDNSLEWHVGNMKYYISSSKLSSEEMLSIAESLTNASVANIINNK